MRIRPKTNMAKSKLKIIPFGGLNEIGKNMMIMEYEDDIIVVDCGLMFPAEDMPGIDLVIPDITYLENKLNNIKGVVITHGHEDHIGALPYILPKLNAPVYATELTKGLISVKLKEGKAKANMKLHQLDVGKQVSLGKFKIEFFHVCHSIPDSVGIIIRTPVGVIVHSGDFKLDYTPVDGKPTDLARLAQLGSSGVLLLLSDSTYAEMPGYTPSEIVVGETLERVIADAEGRVIVATFSSLISRVQQIIDAAVRHQRRVFITGRSMRDTTRMALDLGYLKAPDGVIGRLEQLNSLPPNKVVLVTTGSQGEPTSALVRMANKDHRQVRIISGDTVVISASPIPGNEALVNRTIDSLYKQGAKVFYSKIAKVHVHGHGSQEELKLLLNLVKPKYFMPIHGESRHLSIHGELAKTVGIPKENIFIMEDGDVLELNNQSAKIGRKLPLTNIYVDGLSVGEVGSTVLRNRRMLSHDGIVVVIININKKSGLLIGRPEIVTRGFVDVRESTDMLERSGEVVADALDHGNPRSTDVNYISTKVKDTLNKYYYEKTKRRPMILTSVIEI